MNTRLEQCALLFDEDRHQEIIDLLEKVPAHRRTPEEDSELARAYNNVGMREGKRDYFVRALDLLLPHQRQFAHEYLWNFRVAYAYYWLDRPWDAIPYFEKASKAKPGDEDTSRLLQSCQQQIVCPYLLPSFNEKARRAWSLFARKEESIRQVLDQTRQGTVTREEQSRALRWVHQALEIVIHDLNFELGYDNDRYALILSANGHKRELFVLAHFARMLPESLHALWRVKVGRQGEVKNLALRVFSQEITPKDIRVWYFVENQGVSVQLYCDKLRVLAQEDPDRVEWFFHIMLDQVLGEVASILSIRSFEVLEKPAPDKSVSLARLSRCLRKEGLRLNNDVETALAKSYFGYEQVPNENWDSDWRSDIFVGQSRSRQLLIGYENQSSKTWEYLANQGAFAGFLAFSLAWFDGDDRGDKIVHFRQSLERFLAKECGKKVYCHLGSANGIYACYVDFLAWDIRAILDAVVPFFEKAPVPWAIYHVLRRDGTPIVLKQIEPDESEDVFRVGEDGVLS